MAEAFFSLKKTKPTALGYLDAKSFNFGSQQIKTLCLVFGAVTQILLVWLYQDFSLLSSE